MTQIHCYKLQRLEPALSKAPYPGELGQKILREISQPAWQLWLARQTMLINENRLSPLDPKAKQYLAEQMQAFLFEDGGEQAAGYVPPTT